jgi:hypothetical protein
MVAANLSLKTIDRQANAIRLQGTAAGGRGLVSGHNDSSFGGDERCTALSRMTVKHGRF